MLLSSLAKTESKLSKALKDVYSCTASDAKNPSCGSAEVIGQFTHVIFEPVLSALQVLTLNLSFSLLAFDLAQQIPSYPPLLSSLPSPRLLPVTANSVRP